MEMELNYYLINIYTTSIFIFLNTFEMILKKKKKQTNNHTNITK